MSQINRGRFVWHELMTTDVAAAKKFYGEIAGWTAKPFPGDTTGYEIWHVGEQGIAGLMGIDADMKKMGVVPAWLGHICVDDVDATVKKAQELGAKVHRPAETIPDVGRFCILGDPQGAVVSVFAPSKDGTPQNEDMPLQHIVWNELATTDWEKAFDFYSRVFGWEKADAMDMGGELGTYFMFKVPGGKNAIGGIYNRPKEVPVSSFLYYTHVPDLDAATAKSETLGGKVLNGPMDIPGDMRIVQCLDAQGAAFALLGA